MISIKTFNICFKPHHTVPRLASVTTSINRLLARVLGTALGKYVVRYIAQGGGYCKTDVRRRGVRM